MDVETLTVVELGECRGRVMGGMNEDERKMRAICTSC
jgi:hypothetical protein